MTDVDLLLSNADHALVCDPHGSLMAGVSVAVTDGRIVAIAPAGELEGALRARTTVDLRGHLLMPGLVNLHTHLPMTLLRGIAEDVDLQGFLELVWAEESRVMDRDGTAIGARLGALEALLSGTTTALDMYFHPDAAHAACVEVGLRHVTGPVFFGFPGPDNLTWDQRMELLADWPAILAEAGGPYVPRVLMPHAPFTVGPDRLAELAAWARQNGYLVHTHASENLAENEETIGSFGARPIELLESSGLLALAPVVAHAVQLLDPDRELMSQRGAFVAHCPGSNLKLASGAADIVGYRRQGIGVGLGTDGCSSSNDLDMFPVMRQSANLARLARQDPAAISSREIVLAATVDGARALGLAGRIGSVEVGKEADLIAIDLRVPHLTPLHDPYTAIVYSAGRGDVRHVWVAGEQVVRDRLSTRVSHDDVMRAARERVSGRGVPATSREGA
jgi:5-methylthioadenosine/S-adenosylhomocysteine deaminase